MADVIAIGLRALAYAAALLAAGLPLFVWLFADELDRSARRIRALMLPTAVAAVSLTAVHAVVEPARLTGELSGILDGSLQAMLLGSDFGTTIAVRLLGLLLVVGACLGRGRAALGAGLVGSTLIVVSFAFMGHTAADQHRWFLAPLLIVHLVIVAFWFGSLWPLAAAARNEDPAVAGAVIERFSRIALWAVPAIFLAGAGMAIALLPSLADLGTPYGLSLMTKVAGFALLMALAATNKWRLAPGIARGDRSSLAAFRLSVLAEWVLILAVVAVTATMTALYSPGH